MLQTITNNKWIIGISILLIYLFVYYIIGSSTDIWEVLDFSEISKIAYWESIQPQLDFINVASIILVGVLAGSLLGFISFVIAYYLRLYQSNLRLIFQESFDFLSFIPCVFWGFIYLSVVQPDLSKFPLTNLLQFVAVISVMIFPMLIHYLFKSINNISDEFIEMGYSLGANDVQIAYRLITPKVFLPIFTSMVMIFTRLLVELAILSVVIGIWNFQTIAWSIILIVVLSGVLVFFLKQI